MAWTGPLACLSLSSIWKWIRVRVFGLKYCSPPVLYYHPMNVETRVKIVDTTYNRLMIFSFSTLEYIGIIRIHQSLLPHILIMRQDWQFSLLSLSILLEPFLLFIWCHYCNYTLTISVFGKKEFYSLCNYQSALSMVILVHQKIIFVQPTAYFTIVWKLLHKQYISFPLFILKLVGPIQRGLLLWIKGIK